jgi:hypothetical protein
MTAALHPQTILATRYANETITDPFGYPLRPQSRVQEREMDSRDQSNQTFTDTFWSKRGFNWFVGI